MVVAALSATHLFAFVLKEDFHYYFHNITFFYKQGQKSVQAMLVIMKVELWAPSMLIKLNRQTDVSDKYGQTLSQT